jgi:hypothetical protein
VYVCVGGIISLPWFSNELKTTYQKTTSFVASSLYFSFPNQYSLGGGFPFPIVLVPGYKLPLCHTPIKPDLLGFPGISVFVQKDVYWFLPQKTKQGKLGQINSELAQI